MANYYTHLAFEIPATSSDAERFSKAIEEAAVGMGDAGDEDERL